MVKQSESFDAVIVGAGFAGMYMLHKLRALGLTALVIEAGTGVGGTWYWNRYPGARVDIESMEYSFSFDPELEREWRWSERYAPQGELLEYANHVADRYELRRDIRFETRVLSAHWDESTGRWIVRTDQGQEISARWCIMATGCLSQPKEIDIPGVETFTGTVYKTFAWPREGAELSGKRVAVIGTGSSAIQSIPIIAGQAAQLTVYQRTPNFSVPAWNGPIPPEKQAEWDTNRAELRAEARAMPGAFRTAYSQELAVEAMPEAREQVFEQCWAEGGFQIAAAYADLQVDIAANQLAADFVARKIHSIVTDPSVAEKLIPKDYPFATKRLCVDTGYYATFNQPHVSLVDLRETPIERITQASICTAEGEQQFDVIVLATGFDAMTGALNAIDIRGRDGQTLKDKWADGPRSLLGLSVAGFPNLFTVTGPGSPSVLTNMIMSIEQHVEWISDCIAWLGERQLTTIEATDAAEENWIAHVAETAQTTLYPLANSWYMGANIPGKPRVFLPYVGGFPAYVEACNTIVANDYEGFRTGTG